MRAIRGATQLDEDTREHMLERVAEMVTDVMAANDLTVDDFISIIFTATERPQLGVPGVRRAAARLRRRAADLRPRARDRGLDAPGGPDDGARRDRTWPAPRSPTSTCTGRRTCAATSRRVREVPDEERRVTRPFRGPVLVVGAGLLGTSVGLALRARGVERAASTDVVEENLRTASGLGAGPPAADAGDRAAAGRGRGAARPPRGRDRRRADRRPTPSSPTSAASRPRRCRGARPGSGRPRSTRYVGSHPMAGSERSGPLAASSVLFDGRPWAVAPHATSSPDAVAVVDGAGRGLRRRRRSRSPPRSTTRPWPGPRTCRTWSAASWPAALVEAPPAAPRAVGSGRRATSPGSPPATRGCGSRS